MIELNTVTDFLSEYGQLYHKGDKVVMRCPLCGDSKKSSRKRRFSVTIDNGSAFYNCFNCGRSGTFAELVSELKVIPIAEAIRLVETIEFKNIKNILNKTEVKSTPKVKNEQNLNIILEDCITKDTQVSGMILPKYQEKLLQFISDRKIPSEYNVFIAVQGDYKGRLIIPVYHNNNIVYFQGRSIDNDVDLKYKNPEIEKTDIIMNIDNFQRDKFIIVTEGIIDAMMVENYQGTCVLGGSISDCYLSELYKYTDKGIIIATDNDERGWKERNKLINESKYGKMVKYYITPNNIKDINEYKIKYNIDNMYDLITTKCVDYWTLLFQMKSKNNTKNYK